MEWIVGAVVVWIVGYSSGRKSAQKDYNAIGAVVRKMLTGKD